MERPGAALIAHYQSPDRHQPSKRWSRKHADTQRRLCERFVAPVIATIRCQDIKVAHELTSKEFRDEDLRRPVARHQPRRTPGGHPRRQPLLVGVELPRDVVV